MDRLKRWLVAAGVSTLLSGSGQESKTIPEAGSAVAAGAAESQPASKKIDRGTEDSPAIATGPMAKPPTVTDTDNFVRAGTEKLYAPLEFPRRVLSTIELRLKKEVPDVVITSDNDDGYESVRISVSVSHDTNFDPVKDKFGVVIKDGAVTIESVVFDEDETFSSNDIEVIVKTITNKILLVKKTNELLEKYGGATDNPIILKELEGYAKSLGLRLTPQLSKNDLCLGVCPNLSPPLQESKDG